MANPKLAELKDHLTHFVNDHPEAKMYLRETPDRYGCFRLYFVVRDTDEVEPWEQDDDLLEENLERILGAEVQIGVATADDFEIYRCAAKGRWVAIGKPVD